MKRLILFLTLIFTTAVFPQIQFTTVIFDSVYYGNPGDSTRVLNIGKKTEMYKVIMDSSSNATSDSLSIRSGFIREDGDTVWGDYVSFKDSAFANVVTLTGPSKEYTAMSFINHLIEVILINDRTSLTTRKVRFAIITRE